MAAKPAATGRHARRGPASSHGDRGLSGQPGVGRDGGYFRLVVAALYLALAIALEIVATTALRQSDGFTRLWPTVIVAAGYPTSFYLLSLALRKISLGAAYAIWSGVGTAVVAAIGVIAFKESMNPLKAASLILIIVGVVGLQLAGTHR